MLIDSYNTGTARSNLSKLRNLQRFTQVMKDAGTSQNDIEKRLSDADKELLEEDKFI